MVYYFEKEILVAYILACIITVAIAMKITKSPKVPFVIMSSVLCVYLYFVIKLTQFPIYAGEIFAEDLSGYFWSSFNIIPFNGSFDFGSIQNIIMTMPLGFLIPLIRIKMTSFKQIALIGFLTGVILEALQLITLLANGFTFRVIDVNDVLFNFVGVLTGYFCFKALRAIILLINLHQPHGLKPSKIVSYFTVR